MKINLSSKWLWLFAVTSATYLVYVCGIRHKGGPVDILYMLFHI